MGVALEILIIASLISSSCALLGTFLILKNMAMIADAITHTVLLGIVLAFFIVHDLSSPLLIIGAGAVGVLTVYLVELLHSTKLLKEDAAIGVVFSFLFSIAIILISKFASNVHLDIDTVLLGELAFSPFNRVEILGVTIAKGVIMGGIIFIIDVLFVIIFFKELKISIFDKGLALTLGMKPILIHYMLISLVSGTAVVSFEAVGSILVIAFMVGPSLISYLLTNNLKNMLYFSVIISVLCSIIGFYVALYFDVSIAGTITVVMGILFIITLIFSPKNIFKIKFAFYKK